MRISDWSSDVCSSDLTFGTYACRAVVGVASNRLSGHAIANAVDISAFVLADGRRISVLDDWSSSDPQIRAFMRVIHTSACKRFGTVLSHDYNSATRHHLHLEDAVAHFCRCPGRTGCLGWWFGPGPALAVAACS